jgi:pilus assembly protein CpaE
MSIIAILSAKGGVGASLLATNLGCALAGHGSTALYDLHPGTGIDDVLLDLVPKHTWSELIHVAQEVRQRHLEIAATRHNSGLQLYAAPEKSLLDLPPESLASIIKAMANQSEWLLLDLPLRWMPFFDSHLAMIDQFALVATADPLALRSTRRVLDELPVSVTERTGLVLNQYTARHPTKPRAIAEALHLNLLATLPHDGRAIGFQVNFGRPCVLDPRSGYGRTVSAFASRLVNSNAAHQGKELPSKEAEGRQA